MKKLLSLSLASLMLVLVLCSCSCSVRVGDKTYTTGNDGSAAASDVESAEDTPTGNAHDILFTWKIKLDGVEYTVPFDFSELAAQGYTIDPKYDQDLNSNTYMIMGPSPKKDGVSLSVLFWNPSATTKKLNECKIGEIEIHADGKHELILPGDFKFDETVTVQDILDKYGDGGEVRESDEYTTITYEEDIYNKVEFFMYTKDESMIKYNSVTVKNFV